MAKQELITMAEYARRRGVSQAAVNKAVKRCGIPLIEGKIDPVIADAAWKARTDPVQQQRALGQQLRHQAPGGEINLEGSDDWRRRRERAEAQLAELELEEREGRLCNAADMQRIISRHMAVLRTQMDAIPDRVSAEFGTDDATRRKMRQRLRDELAQIRTELVLAGRNRDQ